MSYSSRMSPTISSIMSSSVMRPISVPYSSTTSAKWLRWRRKALSCSFTGVVSGTNHGFSAIALTSSASARPRDRRHRAEQILGVQNADDVIRLTAIERQARMRALERHGDDLGREGKSASMISIALR